MKSSTHYAYGGKPERNSHKCSQVEIRDTQTQSLESKFWPKILESQFWYRKAMVSFVFSKNTLVDNLTEIFLVDM